MTHENFAIKKACSSPYMCNFKITKCDKIFPKNPIKIAMFVVVGVLLGSSKQQASQASVIVQAALGCFQAAFKLLSSCF